MKKAFVLLAAFLLVFSNFGMVFAAPNLDGPANITKEVTKNNKISKEDVKEATYKATDKVRVIVEVDGEPAITYATKQGKKFSELEESKQTELQKNVLNSQQQVKEQLNSSKVNMDFKENFTTVFNGFSGIVEFGEIKNIEKLSGVTKVTVTNEYERPEAEPDMKYSKEIVEAQRVWDDYGLNGEGMIVGIIDTGIDPSHQDMVLTNEEEASLSEEGIEAAILENDLPGQFHTAKVPYGYNYMDETQEILDLGPDASYHGMHVAGTVGANGDEENGGIKGVAPEAQLLALKVFGNDPEMASTWGDIYIKAIDDAIILGADVLNMSLGSTAAFVNEEDPEQQAVERAVENGVLMSISAGNSAHFGNGFFNPYASNPDIGVVGAPGISYDSLQVASLENSFMDMDAVTYNFGDEEGLAPFMSASEVHPNDIEAGAYEIEFVGIGDAEGFAGKDLTGKFAFAVRGNSFTDTAFNAMEANAEGVIVYNHSDGWVNMASDPAIDIPQLFMLKSDGDLLKEKLDAGETVSLSFNGDNVTTANPLADTMSAFSSWGLTPNLDFKPEITAPGGNILSTLQDDQYGTMSGTSMAAPHVSGGSALVLQRVDEAFDLNGKDRVEMAKNILLNTSAPVVDKGAAQSALEQENPYSPRRQGAGIMQLHGAISTPVVVTETNTGEAKVALKEVNDQISFTLEATNYSDEAVTYDVDANIQTDFAFYGLIGNAQLTGALDELEAQELIDAVVTLNDGETAVEVPANGSATIDVEIDLTEAKVLNEDGSGFTSPEEIFPNGYFVEGFVTLSNEALPELSVPYVGFNGDWNEAPVLDELAYDGNDSFYEQAGVLSDGGDGSYYYLGYDPFTDTNNTSDIAISPNGDGENDEIIPLLSFLRNAKLVEYNVLDEDKNLVRTIKSENNVRKNYFDGGLGAMYYINPANGWDGTVKNEVVADGQYYFEVATTIDYPDKEAQTLEIPVKVDTVAPVVVAGIDGTELTITGSDETSGLSYYEVLLNGDPLGLVEPSEEAVTKYDLGNEFSEKGEVTVKAVDNAGNTANHVVGDEEAPIISVFTPETFSIVSESEVYVLGTVTDDTEIVEVTVEGQEAVVTNIGGGTYIFEAEVEFEDGANPIRITATDINGNVAAQSNSRTIFVDTTSPQLEVDVPAYVNHEITSVSLTAQLADNAEELRLLVDGSEVYYNEMPGYEMVPFSDEVSTSVSLEPGNNVINLELTDLAGNKTTKEVNVYRASSANEDRIPRLKGDDRYATAVEISQEGWETSDVVVLARGDNYADALAGIPLAKKYDSPLLLTKSEQLSEATKAEIDRLDAETVYILGGTAAINENVEAELKNQGLAVERISGKTRYETAVDIANEVVENGSSNEVVLVNGMNFPDALSVASYAAAEGLPILLTDDESVPGATKQALYDLDVSKTLVIGGTVAISDEVFNSVPNALRIKGSDRYATAVAVADYFNVDTNEYYIATGTNYADALSSAALAAKTETGILLVGNNVSEDVSEFISEKDLDFLTVIGGTVAVSDQVIDELAKLLR
ncbi:lactocepin [Virgibacillus profundi]|uniref:Lactocepin n=1 Tax=Virgibacillus profundi TaxID=2024555 RepID=A0A2A2IKQ9_9BACI|nr:lactocepin [Virgibacillus profundi]PXY55869.1 lactocepin [Virgibacillus profundi]